MDCKENDVGCFILCLVTDVDGKMHRLFFPEGRGLINGWTLLAEVLQGLGVKGNTEEKRKPCETKSQRKEEFFRGGLSKDISFVEITKNGVRKHDIVWLDVSGCIPRGDLGMLKYGVVGRWKSLPETVSTLPKLES